MTFINRLFLILVNPNSSDALGEYRGLTDKELIEKINASKNTLLFSILYDRYSKKVYNKCYSFARDENDAKDLTQDVFLKLFIQLSSFRGESKFSTWLFAFTYNFCVNYVKRDVKKSLRSVSDHMESHEYYLSVEEDSIDEELFEMKVAKLKKALEMIAPEEKAILLLKYQDNASLKEIQKLLKISESATKMRLKRAKAKVVVAHNKIE